MIKLCLDFTNSQDIRLVLMTNQMFEDALYSIYEYTNQLEKYKKQSESVSKSHKMNIHR